MPIQDLGVGMVYDTGGSVLGGSPLALPAGWSTPKTISAPGALQQPFETGGSIWDFDNFQSWDYDLFGGGGGGSKTYRDAILDGRPSVQPTINTVNHDGSAGVLGAFAGLASSIISATGSRGDAPAAEFTPVYGDGGGGGGGGGFSLDDPLVLIGGVLAVGAIAYLVFAD